MNIESATTTTATTTTSTADSSAQSTATKKDDSTSFKDQLDAVKAKETKTAQTDEAASIKTAEDTKITKDTETQKAASVQVKTEDLAKNQLAQQLAKDKLTKETDAKKSQDATDPISELSSKIAAISQLKNGISKTQGVDLKSKELADKSDISQTIKMNTEDTSFFLSLVQNQQMSAQAGQGSSSSLADKTFTDIKAEATQQAVQVSSTLLDAMNESAKTGKSFRIDFDSDVAVIMKVDRNGTISANFIPGDTAVENYLRNNISLLKQSFDDKGLAYNELTYTKQQKQDQGQQEKRKNKENEDE